MGGEADNHAAFGMLPRGGAGACNCLGGTDTDTGKGYEEGGVDSDDSGSKE